MELEHVAIWTDKLELLKDYYVKYFDGIASEKYMNVEKNFESYFLHFESGARLELMKMPRIPENKNDTVQSQHLGIVHIAFGVSNPRLVDEKARQLKADGFEILLGPRITGDGYYEFETLDPDKNRLEVTTLYTE